MLSSNTDPILASRCQWIAYLCAWAVAALGLVVLAGWALDLEFLKNVRAGWATMKISAAAGFVLAGLGLAAALRKGTPPGHPLLQRAPAAALIVLGALTLVHHFVLADLGEDGLLAMVLPDPDGMSPPIRMAQATAAGFLFTGLGLLLLDTGRGRLIGQLCALAGNLIGMLALLGYAYGVAALYEVNIYASTPIHAAAALVVINVGILLARPHSGLAAIITSTTAGGVMARRLLPVALVAPFVIGWFLLYNHMSGRYADEFDIAVATIAYVILLTVFIWRTAEVLRHSDHTRSAAERALRQQQGKLAGIIGSAMDAIVMVDAEHRIVLFNPAAERMFGRRAMEVIGSPLEVLLPHRFRPKHSAEVRRFGASAAGSRPLSGSSVMGLRANGDEFPVEITISQLDLDGEQYFTAIVRDVTESRRVQEALREHEAHLKLAMEVARIGTWERDLVSGVGSWSPEVKAILGTDAETYTFEDFIGYIHPDDRARISAALSVTTPEKPFELEYRIVRPNGELRWVNERGLVIPDEQGKPASVLGAARDITDRREMMNELRRSKLEAERANNAKSRFLAAASHDLRQPLSALSIYVDLLRSHVAPGGEPLVANLRGCIASLSELLTDLLDLSKLEAGVVTPSPADFPMNEILSNLVAIHAPEAALKGLRLRCVPTRLIGHTDPVLFQRILGNFIENAIRYTEHGGVLVVCRQRGGKTWVEVRDSGVGIPEDKIDEVFEEFKQLGDGSRNRGSGLGLAIVARTAALLKLKISVRSRPGRGSVFAIEIPPGEARRALAPEVSPAAYRSLRIVLVEDNPLVREALAKGLEAAGHRMLAGEGGADVLAGLAHFRPDIVVSDYRLMHGETGFDVITAVRAATEADLPAILITGDTDPCLVRSMADRGIAVLHKPLDLETIQAYLDDLTSLQNLPAELAVQA